MNETRFPGLETQEILRWLSEKGWRVEASIELTGDVSPRRYVRVESGSRTAILALYPGEIRSACGKFLVSTRLLAETGVRVPRILASDCEQGLTLLEDVGSATLYDLRETPSTDLESFFWLAVSDLDRIQSIEVEAVEQLNPRLNGELLWQELRKTLTILFAPRRLLSDPSFCSDLERTLQSLCTHLGKETPVPCHRDYMSRNLVPLASESQLVVLDHQDLRLGPPLYDLASLLNDSLFPSAALEEEIVARTVGDSSSDRIRYHRSAAQRTLKAAGTYESFAQRGFPRHRQLIPATLKRSVRHLRGIPEAASIVSAFEERLSPLLIC